MHYCSSYCKRNGIPLNDTLLYLKNVLYWPKDDRLRSKHVAVTWPDCIYFITVMIYCCVLKASTLPLDHRTSSYCKRNRIPLNDTLLYLKNVLYWRKDDRLRSKHVAVTWPDCIYFITVMVYCVLTVYNTLYKRVVRVITKGGGEKNNIIPDPVLGTPCNSLANIEW